MSPAPSRAPAPVARYFSGTRLVGSVTTSRPRPSIPRCTGLAPLNVSSEARFVNSCDAEVAPNPASYPDLTPFRPSQAISDTGFFSEPVFLGSNTSNAAPNARPELSEVAPRAPASLPPADLTCALTGSTDFLPICSASSRGEVIFSYQGFSTGGATGRLTSTAPRLRGRLGSVCSEYQSRTPVSARRARPYNPS